MPLNLTKLEFYELFLVCLYWQNDCWQNDRWRDGLLSPPCPTTVYKVAQVLNGLGLLRDGQIEELQNDTELQELFCSKTQVIFEEDLEYSLITSTSQLLRESPMERYMHTSSNAFSILLRSDQIYLTPMGNNAVRDRLEEQYAAILTFEQYYNEIVHKKSLYTISRRAWRVISRRYNEHSRK